MSLWVFIGFFTRRSPKSGIGCAAAISQRREMATSAHTLRTHNVSHVTIPFELASGVLPKLLPRRRLWDF